MNQLHTDRSSSGSWWLTGFAGAVSTTAVTLLLSTVVSTPAHAAPTNFSPADPDIVTAVTSDSDYTPVIRYCFMGRPGWHDALAGPPPDC